MKNVCGIILLSLVGCLSITAKNVNDSLLRELDKVISLRKVYTIKKQVVIRDLQARISSQTDLSAIYDLNSQLIDQYETFVCDSAEKYINTNLLIANKLKDYEKVLSSKLHLAFVYSLSGLFVQADQIFQSIHSDKLPDYLKAIYCWDRIRYFENLIRYTDDSRFSIEYTPLKEAYRDTVMTILYEPSDEYQKERAVKLQMQGRYKESLEILLSVFNHTQPGTHGYAMVSMGLAQAYRLTGNETMEEKHLILAAMTDIQVAVKENEALLQLAINLFEKGDVNRSFRYIQVALEDAVFYNSRFKNTVIARVHPIIEDAYRSQIEQQRKNLSFYFIMVSVFAGCLVITLIITFKQKSIVSKTRRHLKKVNEDLMVLNTKLDEANLVKEKYVGYFMNQCALYINKLDEYRKNVNRKIKTGKVDELYKASSRPFERELEDLYVNFDKAFLKLYPLFVNEFNALLKPKDRYVLRDGQLNTELRIFALIRLGITDVGQIAVFLHYSVQTIYNYKSKVKKNAIIDGNLFEEKIKTLSSLSLR